MDQIVDIATDGRHLSRERGFLKVSEGADEIGRIPLDQIAGVIVHAHGTTWSASLLTALADRGAPVVLCGSNHAPRSVLLPIEGHHAQGARLRAQWQAKAPFMKQPWKRVVLCQITMQAAALAATGEARSPLSLPSRSGARRDRRTSVPRPPPP
ncbi:MAG: CRISPR-associated endonuclease Cas1, partial [Rhodobacteraceae bacterium]|nr:CRISPR-associated endonuclease Cas1 [Paracoccaceae bacterium]